MQGPVEHFCHSCCDKYVKCLSSRFSTLYGPSYGLCTGFLVPSCLMYTCVHDERSLLKYDFCGDCLRAGGALSLAMVALS